jgi:hypothetical protein
LHRHSRRLANLANGWIISLGPNFPLHRQQLVNVTTSRLENVYTYSWSTLWLVYGIAIFLTAVASIHGLCLIYASGASYSNVFSTIMRSTWVAELDVDFAGPVDHQDPLPKDLAKAAIKFPPTRRKRSNKHPNRDNCVHTEVNCTSVGHSSDLSQGLETKQELQQGPQQEPEHGESNRLTVLPDDLCVPHSPLVALQDQTVIPTDQGDYEITLHTHTSPQPETPCERASLEMPDSTGRSVA